MIAAVVVTFSAPPETLDRCLRAVCGEPEIERVVVVDTGGRASVAGDLPAAVEVIATENRGYGAAANLGFAAVGDASAVLLLNDDAVVRRGAVDPLVRSLADARVGAVQPLLVGRDHDRVASRGVGLDRFGAGFDLGDGERVGAVVGDAGKGPAYEPEACDIEIFTGGAVLLSRSFLADTGGFDESYFLYYEDVDLALRGRERGWTYRLVPAAVVEHERGTTTAGHVALTRHLQERNRLWVAFRFAPASTIIRAIWLSVRRLRHEPRGVHAKAFAAGLAGAPRRMLDRARGRTRVVG